MKIRTCFVSNSSSTSYILQLTESISTKQIIEELIEFLEKFHKPLFPYRSYNAKKAANTFFAFLKRHRQWRNYIPYSDSDPRLKNLLFYCNLSDESPRGKWLDRILGDNFLYWMKGPAGEEHGFKTEQKINNEWVCKFTYKHLILLSFELH